MPAIEGEACAAREGGYAAVAWREEACAARTICNRGGVSSSYATAAWLGSHMCAVEGRWNTPSRRVWGGRGRGCG